MSVTVRGKHEPVLEIVKFGVRLVHANPDFQRNRREHKMTKHGHTRLNITLQTVKCYFKKKPANMPFFTDSSVLLFPYQHETIPYRG